MIMSSLRKIILALVLLTSGAASAGTFSDYQFNQEKMILTTYCSMILSSFENTDHISAYNDNGVRLWEVTFLTKVLSWKLKDGRLYTFSKSRFQETTYLTCIDPVTGLILWERP